MKPSEQLRELLAWYSKTDCNDIQRTSMLLRGVELLIPAVEQLEQAQREGDAEIHKQCGYLSVFEKDEHCILREGHGGLHVMEKIAE